MSLNPDKAFLGLRGFRLHVENDIDSVTLEFQLVAKASTISHLGRYFIYYDTGYEDFRLQFYVL